MYLPVPRVRRTALAESPSTWTSSSIQREVNCEVTPERYVASSFDTWALKSFTNAVLSSADGSASGSCQKDSEI
jgi:hypothetical protein